MTRTAATRVVPRVMPGAMREHRGTLAGAGVAALAATTAAGLWWQLFRRPLPQTRGRLRASGLRGEVLVRRDRWGVPHIRAGNRHDLWFAQGFCQGQDRLWQLELYRRIACGRLAEVAGPDALRVDRLMRTLGLRRSAQREAAAIEGPYRSQLEAFCHGLTTAAGASRVLPAEFQLLRIDFEPWTLVDMLTTTKLLSLGLSTNWEQELVRSDLVRNLGEKLAARLDPAYPRGNPVITAPGEPWSGDGVGLADQITRVREAIGLASGATGSNNWAVSGARSATGGPLVAGDPHLPPSMPGVTYQVGLYLGDRFCRGGSLPGIPGVTFGQNNDVAWTFTNAMADVMDLYVERIDGAEYEFGDERLPLWICEEEIRVRGRRDPERLVVRATHHGPIVNDALSADESEPLALRWMTLDFPAVTEANLRAMDVASGPDLVGLLEHLHTPVSNLVWADRHGSIGYKTIGRIPLRGNASPDLPKPGWTAEHEWQGWVPYDELPELRDPERGFVVTANNRIAPDDYPHHITSDYLDGYRARRIEQLIEAQETHDLDSFGAMQLDMLSLPGLETVRRLVRLRARNQRETRALERLRSWDGRMSPDSVAATIYQAFTLRFAREVSRAAIRDRDLAQRWLDRADNGFIPHVAAPWRWQSHLLALWEEGDESLVGRPWGDLALDALRRSLDELEERFGSNPDRWRWGKVHSLEFPHSLGGGNPVLGWILNREVEVGGAQETVAQVGWNPQDPFHAIWAPCWRMVADPVQPDRSRWQAFTGQSGHPGSPHYDDLQGRWLAGETQLMEGEGPWRELTLEP
jgi:penicillin G amidase